jgi:DNA-directed RNA polymerase subunit RPC12/RpoP
MNARTEQAYQQRIAELEARVAELSAQVARLLKNSSNSSKPPSSDIVKPPKPPPGAGGGKIGGQPGHPRHERAPFPPDQIDRVERYDLHACPDCGGKVLRARAPARVRQQIELAQRPVEIVEYQAGAYQCVRCGKIHYAPPAAAGGEKRADRAGIDGAGGLSQGRMPRLVLHHPQVLPRRA